MSFLILIQTVSKRMQFNILYLSYSNFFLTLTVVVIDSPICNGTFLLEFSSEQVKYLEILSRISSLNKACWFECLTVPDLLNFSNMHNVVDMLGSVIWDSIILNSSFRNLWNLYRKYVFQWKRMKRIDIQMRLAHKIIILITYFKYHDAIWWTIYNEI